MREFILNSPCPILRIGKDGTVLYTNEAGKLLLEPLRVQVGEKVSAEMKATLRRLSLRKKPEQIELKAGEKTYSITFTPLPADQCTILSAFDITPSKQIEEKLFSIDRECRFLPQIAERALKAPDFRSPIEEILYLVTEALDVEYCKIIKLLPDGNFLFEKGTGWKPEEIGKRIYRKAASAAGYSVLSSRPIMLQKLNEKDSIKNLGFEGYPKILSGISVLIGRVEKPYGLLVVHSVKKEKFTKEDAYFLNSVAVLISLIIERKEVEETLKNKVNFLETLLDTIPTPVFYKDSDGIYQGCNEIGRAHV